MTTKDEPRVLVRIDERRGDGHVAHVAINNSAKLNCLNTPVMTDLVAAIRELEKDEALRVVVLTGVGDKSFIGGADLNELTALDPDSAEAMITLVHQCCDCLRRLPVPVIGRVNGYALGAGLEVMAACDRRVASDNAVFGMPEVKLGLPSVVEAALLPQLIGWGKTRELLFTGDTIDSAEALRCGLVEKVVPALDLDAAVEAWITSIVESGPRAIRLQKELIQYWETVGVSDGVQEGIRNFTRSWQNDEPSRMIRSFLDRRRK